MPDDIATLTVPVIKLLLLGPRAVPPLRELSPADLVMVSFLFKHAPHSYAEAWVEHESFLRSEAARLNLRPPAHGGTQFYAEEIARREQAHREREKQRAQARR